MNFVMFSFLPFLIHGIFSMENNATSHIRIFQVCNSKNHKNPELTIVPKEKRKEKRRKKLVIQLFENE